MAHEGGIAEREYSHVGDVRSGALHGAQAVALHRGTANPSAHTSGWSGRGHGWQFMGIPGHGTSLK